MRWHSPILVAAIGGVLIACAPAEAPPDERTPPPAADAADPTPPDTATAAPQIIHYDCEGTPVDATFDGGDRATVQVDGMTLAMQTEPAASGAKYVDGAGNVLWTRGATDALLMRPDQPDRSCSGSPAAPV